MVLGNSPQAVMEQYENVLVTVVYELASARHEMVGNTKWRPR